MGRRGAIDFFFFNDTATTEIYTLSLHDALPISPGRCPGRDGEPRAFRRAARPDRRRPRSEEHTSELQSQSNLVCRLLLEKKKKRLPCLPELRQVPAPSHNSAPRRPPL